MSLASARADLAAIRFPRVSGDEPTSVRSRLYVIWFSPRERG